MGNNLKEEITTRRLLRFLIPSLIGAFLFMVPVPYGEGFTIPISIVIKTFNKLFEPALPGIAVVIVCVSAIACILAKTAKPAFIMNNQKLKDLFDISPIWFLLRVLGMVFILMVFFGVGPEAVNSEATGQFILYDLLSSILAIALFAGGLLPLLLEFGLLEFVGAYLAKCFRFLFTLPGRSAVDCITSWLGDASVAVLLTANQYEDGYYTAREASVIATTFSAVSITFTLVVIEQVKLGELFVPYYLTLTAVGVVCAVIMPRIPPLSLKKDTRYRETGPLPEHIPSGYTTTQWAIKSALDKANKGDYNMRAFAEDATKNFLLVVFNLAPVIMAIGTISLILSEYTPVLEWLGAPFTPLLNLLGLPEAQAASKTMVVGFADMFIPAIIASAEISTPLTRFVIAVVSVTQLLYLSENGAMILGSKIPVSFVELFVIFLERTIISVTMATLIARFVLKL